VTHVGEEFRFGLVGFFGAGFFFGVFLGKFGEKLRLAFEFGLRAFEVDDVGGEAHVVVDELLFVFLDLRNIGTDRDVAAVLGAALADVQPATVVELRLECPRAGRERTRQARADFRHAADFDHGLVGCALLHRRVRQLVQPLEMRVAQHEAVLGVPQHEGFRDGFDGVAQPQIGFDGFLGKTLLLGDVDGDPDQMRAVAAGALAEFAADAQPDPVAAAMTHAEGLVDVIDLARHQPVGDLEQVDVVGHHQRIDFAECQKVAAAFQPQDREHRLRPENASTRQVPVPQSAASAIERGVDTRTHGVIDGVALACAGRLPMKREAENEHHKAGGRGQCNLQRRVRARRLLDLFLHDDDLTGQRLDDALGGEAAPARRKVHFDNTALRALRGQQLRRAEHVENVAGVFGRHLHRKPRHDALIGAGDDDMPAGRNAPCRHHARKKPLQTFGRRFVLADRADAIKALHHQVGQRRNIALHRRALLAALVQHLNEGADKNGDEKCDDEGGDCAAEGRFCDQQTPVGRLCDGLCHSLDRIGLDTGSRCVRTRHSLRPSDFFVTPPVREDFPASRITNDLNPLFRLCRESTIR